MWKWSLSLHHRKKLNIFTPQLLIYYIQYENRKSRLVQMPEPATGGVLRKKVFFKMSQNSEETSVNFARFLRTSFLQNNSGRLLLKCGYYCNNESRDIDCICCRELDAMLIASAKIPEREGNISPSSFYGRLPDYQSHVLVLSTW